MARITLRQLLDHAAEHAYGVPAFNINNMEQGLAIMDAAAAVDAPVIIQASRGARSYANDVMLAKMIDALEEMHPQIPLCLHQDHGNEESTCATALQHGFTSVMMDGSLKADAKTAASYEYNEDAFNAFGGEMPQTWGVPVEEIVRGIKHGVRKVNIDTDCRLAMTAAFRKVAVQSRNEFDPRKFLKPAMDALRELCRERFEQFGTAGHASRIKVVPLSEMAKRYRSGALDPRIGGMADAAE